MRRALVAGLVVLLAATGSGCALEASEPPDEEPRVVAPPVEPVSPAVPEAVRVRVPVPRAASFARRAQELTVRVRNVSCLGVGVGSGFAVARDLLITNRHVLAGASVLEVSTWDGRTLDVEAAEVGVLGDIGVALVDGRLPRVGAYGAPPPPGAPVTVAGYPLGGRLDLRPGTVIDYVDGARFDIPGRVMRFSARVEPGNSGGPVLNRRGRIVAVVFAIELATSYALAIPMDTLHALVRRGGFEPVPPCGSE
ncbi:MAG TPA: trypsin-like peptidase domain-containing protein [Gaiellaceae bacterium]|nr:trypsin-like peptidase domain-containing protein [Gaiellaceae bacterium]